MSSTKLGYGALRCVVLRQRSSLRVGNSVGNSIGAYQYGALLGHDPPLLLVPYPDLSTKRSVAPCPDISTKRFVVPYPDLSTKRSVVPYPDLSTKYPRISTNYSVALYARSVPHRTSQYKTFGSPNCYISTKHSVAR
eukprot:2544042-Rhodomonas_salina.1